jgi:virulence factor
MELKKVIEDMSVIAVNFRRLSPFKGSNTDVDVVLDLMVHDLDLCNDLFGHQPHIAGVAGLSPLSNNLDHVVAQLCYPNGPVVTLTASRVTEEKIRSIEVTTKEAYIEADSLNKNISVHRRTTGIYTDQNHQGVKYRQESVIERIVVPTVEPLAAELGHFIECIQNNQEPCVSLQDGLEALRLALQIGDMAKEQTRQLEPAD